MARKRTKTPKHYKPGTPSAVRKCAKSLGRRGGKATQRRKR